MIHTSRQLKALVRNMSKGNSAKAQIIIRNYVMERFLERLSLSEHRRNIILKGGVLVSAMVGLDNRSTMDVDATIKRLPLSEETAKRIIEDVISVSLEDGMIFEIKSIRPILDEADYSGIRVMLNAALETMNTPLKIDFSTGDAITPHEISYSFKLLFEDRTISLLAYNLETVLAEKLETLLTRGTANTRMRDFYDIYALMTASAHNIDPELLRSAFANTCERRGTQAVVADPSLILDEVESSRAMMTLWKGYQRKFDYAADTEWSRIMQTLRGICRFASIGVP